MSSSPTARQSSAHTTPTPADPHPTPRARGLSPARRAIPLVSRLGLLSLHCSCQRLTGAGGRRAQVHRSGTVPDHWTHAPIRWDRGRPAHAAIRADTRRVDASRRLDGRGWFAFEIDTTEPNPGATPVQVCQDSAVAGQMRDVLSIDEANARMSRRAKAWAANPVGIRLSAASGSCRRLSGCRCVLSRMRR